MQLFLEMKGIVKEFSKFYFEVVRFALIYIWKYL